MNTVTPSESQVLSGPEMAKGLGKALLSLLVRLACFGLAIGNIAFFAKSLLYHAFTPDLPWIIRSGQYVLENMRLPTHDVFSWTFPEKPWVLYQWLFEAITAWGYSLVGESLLVRGFIVLVLTLYVFWPLWQNGRRKIPFLFTVMVSTAALMTASINMSLRPMAVTTLFLIVQHFLVTGYREKRVGFKSVLAGLVGIYVLWGNMHTGVFLGLVSLGLFALGDWLETREVYAFTPTVAELEGQPVSWRFYTALIMTGFLASLINPYGIGIYSYLADLSSQQFLNEVIIELQSPNFHNLYYWYFTLLLGMFILLMTRAQRVFPAHVILHVLVFTFATLCVQRFVVWSCLFYTLMLPKALTHWYQDKSSRMPMLAETVKGFEIYKPLFWTLISVILMIFLVFPKALQPFRLYLPVQLGSCDTLKAGILAYQKLRLPTDRVYTEPEIGSCTLWFTPQQKVFIDTRFDFYGQHFTEGVQKTADLIQDWEAFFQKWQINTVFLSKQWPILHILAVRPAYHKIYEDEAVVIYRRQKTDG